MPDLNDGYVKDVVGGSIPGSNITLTVDASTGEIQSTVVWTEAPRDTHIHLACSSRRARHGGGRLSLKPVGSAEAAWRQRGFSPSLIPDTWEKLALLPAGPPPMAPLLPTHNSECSRGCDSVLRGKRFWHGPHVTLVFG